MLCYDTSGKDKELLPKAKYQNGNRTLTRTLVHHDNLLKVLKWSFEKTIKNISQIKGTIKQVFQTPGGH